MIYLILDVHYQDNESANNTTAIVTGVRFSGIEHATILSEHIIEVNDVAPYQSGQFYKREMPCLLALIEQIQAPFDVIIIDGYVFLDGINQAGLGKYLYDHLADQKPIIGIAKNRFADITEDYAVWRGVSKHPLYVTSVGLDNEQAKTRVKTMDGNHRIPTMVNHVDRLGRA